MRKSFYFLLDLLLLRTWHIKRALRKIARGLPDRASVLDAGAGFGQYTWRMSRINRNWKITAIDIEKDLVEDCRKFFHEAGLDGRVTWVSGDLTGMNDTGIYDLILSVDVMEHIREDELVFRNFSRALRYNGKLLISTPSDRGGSDVRNKDDHSFIDEHVRDGYSVEELAQKLDRSGFRNISVSYTYGKPGNISWLLSMKYPVQMLNFSGFLFFILPFYYLLVLPAALLLNTLDIFITHRSGTGLLVSAGK